MSTTDPRETTHMPCNCVPDLGPEHCHLCSTEQGREVPWDECRGPHRDEEKR